MRPGRRGPPRGAKLTQAPVLGRISSTAGPVTPRRPQTSPQCTEGTDRERRRTSQGKRERSRAELKEGQCDQSPAASPRRHRTSQLPVLVVHHLARGKPGRAPQKRPIHSIDGYQEIKNYIEAQL